MSFPDAQLTGDGGGGGGFWMSAPRLLKTESYFGRGEAAKARATSSLNVDTESAEGRRRVCCIFEGWGGGCRGGLVGGLEGLRA